MEDQTKELLELWERVSNRGRWGDDDQKGTLNFITAEKRLEAAKLVKLGRAVSLSKPLDTRTSVKNPIPAVHYMLFDQVDPVSALDWIGVAPHGFCVTHLDCVAHVNWEGNIYNGRRSKDVITSGGVTFGSIDNLREGIFTRGVFLDVCEVRGVPYLPVGEFVTIDDLEKAEKRAGVRVESGDAIFVRVGFDVREQAEGPTDAAKGVPGIHAEVLGWLHDRQVAVWSGDCVERMPYPSKRFPLPLHMIGLGSMGLVQLDIPDVETLKAHCRELGRNEFLLTAAPLYVKGGTGTPINPIAVFQRRGAEIQAAGVHPMPPTCPLFTRDLLAEPAASPPGLLRPISRRNVKPMGGTHTAGRNSQVALCPVIRGFCAVRRIGLGRSAALPGEFSEETSANVEV